MTLRQWLSGGSPARCFRTELLPRLLCAVVGGGVLRPNHTRDLDALEKMNLYKIHSVAADLRHRKHAPLVCRASAGFVAELTGAYRCMAAFRLRDRRRIWNL